MEDIDTLFDFYPELREVEPIPVELRAGQAAVHNGLTAHGAGANMTPGWCRATTCAYMPDGAVFNGKQNILSEEIVAGLKIGDPLDDESHNPLVWSRS